MLIYGGFVDIDNLSRYCERISLAGFDKMQTIVTQTQIGSAEFGAIFRKRRY